MKLHMRRLNKRNGNVFEKAKFLKTKLERVQKSLDKDPHNALLREEKMVYSRAYTDVVLDEEKLLKQKTKIEWLKEGDHNTAYFHKVLKGGPILDKEIRAAMFDIKDDKAAGPDGFTSKFFKKAWAIVGPDVCYAVREFLISGKLLGELNTNLCISKVLTNKLKKGLDGLVDINQCAFILGRHISDNILLTQDLMVGYDWKSRTSNCAFKVDIKNAYDTVNWGFLRTILFYDGSLGCKSLGLTHLCFADDLLLLCHGDQISACVLRRGLDEFSMCSGLYPKGTLPIRYLRVPMMTRKLRNDDCRVLIDNVKKKIFDWKNKYLSIDKILTNFLWGFEESRKGFTNVAWNDICVPKSQGGLGLRSVKLMNEAWCWRHILKLRDKIRDYVGFKIGNGKSCFIWFDKWHSNGPLCKLITHNLLYSRGFDVTNKVVDRIQNNMWTWPSDWTRRFKDVLDVSVLILNEFEDKAIWFNKKFEEINFSVKEVCNVLRYDMPSVMWHEHVWYTQCIPRHAFILWFPLEEDLRPEIDYLNGFIWIIVSVPCAILLFPGTVEVVFNLIVNTIRLKLPSFDIKWSKDVGIAAKVWPLPNLVLEPSYRFVDDMDIDDSFLYSYYRNLSYYGCNMILTSDDSLQYGLILYDRSCIVDGFIIVVNLVHVCPSSNMCWSWVLDGFGGRMFGCKLCTTAESLNFGQLGVDSICEIEVLAVIDLLFNLFRVVGCVALLLCFWWAFVWYFTSADDVNK
ncbi:hypothetical protein Tco_1060318, partial [Tanacetum coccineum]